MLTIWFLILLAERTKNGIPALFTHESPHGAEPADHHFGGGPGPDLGPAQILDTLLHFGDCNQKTIAGYCEIEPATMGSLLLRMEKAGLIRRYQKDGNRRSLYVTLTDEGRAAATEMDAIFRQEDARAVQALTEAETRQLKDLLARVGDTLGRDAGQDGAQ